jgi:hypothetical protein
MKKTPHGWKLRPRSPDQSPRNLSDQRFLLVTI